MGAGVEVRGQGSRTQAQSPGSCADGCSGDKNRSLPFVSTWHQALSDPGPGKALAQPTSFIHSSPNSFIHCLPSFTHWCSLYKIKTCC